MVHKKMSRPGKKAPARKPADRPRLQKKSVDIKKIKKSRLIKEDIPFAYNVDTIVIMPVNVDRNFIYWEVTGKLLDEKGMGRGQLKLMVRVHDADTDKKIYSFEVHERVGKHYMSCPAQVTSMYAEIGAMKGKIFRCLLKSNSVSLTTVSYRSADHEVWMRRVKDSGEGFHASDIEVTRISKYNPFLHKHFQQLRNLDESPFSSSTHLRKHS
jgi:hypothetical protein